MIYSPSRFVFIHIPRTSGLSISQAVASRILEINDTTINLSGLGSQGYWRHTRACDMVDRVPHWKSIYRFSVMRNPWAIVQSFWRLVQASLPLLDDGLPAYPRADRDYWRFLYATSRMTFEDWIPWHFDYLAGSGGFWRYWCCGRNGDDLGIDAIRFEQLDSQWPTLCDRIGLPGLQRPHANRSEAPLEAWTPKAIKCVASLCPDDINRFGHSPPSVSSSIKDA